MSTSIQTIGKYFHINKAGFLENPAHWGHVPQAFHETIDCIKKSYCQFYQEDLHSLYLRGSIVRGTFVERKSDIDVFGLVQIEGKKWEHTSFEESLSKTLNEKYSYSGDIELMISSFSNDLPSIYPALAMILKTQSLCIWGNDIISNLAPYRPDRSLLFHFRWLENDIKSALSNDFTDYQDVMKLMIRCGFELVLERSGTYTADLFPAVKSFGHYYPGCKSAMEKTLFYFLNPNENVAEQKQLIITFGYWLIDEINTHLR